MADKAAERIAAAVAAFAATFVSARWLAPASRRAAVAALWRRLSLCGGQGPADGVLPRIAKRCAAQFVV